jgi:hypothetical protein
MASSCSIRTPTITAPDACKGGDTRPDYGSRQRRGGIPAGLRNQNAASAEARRCSRDCSRAWSAAAASARKASKSIATVAVSCNTSADVDGRGIATNKAAQKVTMAATARIRTVMVKLPARPLPPRQPYTWQPLRPREARHPAWTQHVSHILTRGRRPRSAGWP